jgi:peptidoglycan/xylan/chitin deacetylase (PgdA/CDA1 family)
MLFALALAVAGLAAERWVSITIDDLPFVSAIPLPADEVRARTEALLSHLRSRGVRATGFVNEGKFFEGEREDPAGAAHLSLWLDAGMELGNHSYSHGDLNDTPLAAFQEDVLKGEIVTRRLLEARGLVPRFFRHPFLHTGRELEKKAAFEAFLAKHGYRVAPVTIDNYDYLFARAYDLADAPGKDRVEEAYLRYMTAVVAFYEDQSRAILGYELPQILLLHANSLNAKALGRLLDMFTSRGYEFVPLERALEDKAFSSEDTYVGPAGVTWLHRWAMTRGVEKSVFAGEPEPSAFLPELR